MDRPLRRWTRHPRFFRLEAPAAPAARPGFRPRLEVLEDRVGPGEATGGVIAAALGVSVLDPAAAGLALFGLSVQPPLADAPSARTATAEPADAAPVLPAEPLAMVPQRPAGSATSPVAATETPAADPLAMDDDLFAALLDDFWGPFTPSNEGTASSAPVATGPAASPAATAASGGPVSAEAMTAADGTADGAAAGPPPAASGATDEMPPPAPAAIEPLRFQPLQPAPPRAGRCW